MKQAEIQSYKTYLGRDGLNRLVDSVWTCVDRKLVMYRLDGMSVTPRTCTLKSFAHWALLEVKKEV